MSFIDNIEIKNFKSIAHQKIEGCKRINVFVGPPNVGKSNILEAVGLFSCLQIDSSSFRFNEICRLSRVADLFFNKNINEYINIDINNHFGITFFPPYSNNRVEESSPSETENFDDFNFMISDIGNRQVYTRGIDRGTQHTNITVNTSSFKIKKHSTQAFDRDLLYNKIKTYRYTDDVKYKSSKNYLSLNVPNGNNLVEILHGNEELRKFFRDMIINSNLRLNIESNSTSFGVAKDLGDNTYVSFDNNLLADTLKRTLFYKAAIISNHETVLLFEEPEANCFEPYILEITNSIKYDKNSNQFFIVTHSQYVIDELLRDEESRKDTNIYLVGDSKGESKVKLLNKNTNDDVFRRGLNIFFNYKDLWEENS